ncbi:MAG: hypothetical protein WAT74_14555 [Flavobacteriales bacterium]
MQAPWQRSLLATIMALAVLPYFMARAFPHECHSDSSDSHEQEAAWLSSDCALCDLAMPVAESLPEPSARVAIERPLAQVATDLATITCPASAGFDARGPPRA